ncbi:MAG TPA: hypothetical protein VLJ17_24705 [Xanthobacteraceae bacterium]|nr:hypothetical protein [Xanthobacteraceae bacterium]
MSKSAKSLSLRECAEAKAWRTSRALTIKKLAELTGFSCEAIMLFEKGKLPNGRPIKTEAWVRYRHICGSIDILLRSGAMFRWGDTWQTGS